MIYPFGLLPRELIPKGLEKGDLPYPLKMGRALISSEVAGGGKNRIPVVPEEKFQGY